MKKRIHIVLGLALWIALLAALRASLQTYTSDSKSGGAGDIGAGIGDWLLHRRSEFDAKSGVPLEMAIGTPVLVMDDSDNFRQVGVVRNNFVPPPAVGTATVAKTNHARVVIYDSGLDTVGQRFVLTYHRAPSSLASVAESLLPEERKQQIAQLITEEWTLHQEQTLRTLQPIMQESVQRAIKAIQAELPDSIRRHRSQFTGLGEKYKAEIFRKELAPLVQTHILPIVEREAKPLVSEIGRTLWNKVSLWSFAWRYAYDVSPLPRKNAVQEEFERFVEAEALPELRSRSDQFVALIESVVQQVSKDPVVSRTIRKNLSAVASDSELHGLVWEVVRESVLHNQALRDSLNEYWNSPETRAALQQTSSAFEPVARRIGDMIIGSREEGITPEMSRILRLQILMKDRHWLVITPVTDPADSDEATGSKDTVIPIVVSTDLSPYPITFDDSSSF
ncbi:MAG: hypothetical protein R3C20_13155 [Planctomycetaceae bacterium]